LLLHGELASRAQNQTSPHCPDRTQAAGADPSPVRPAGLAIGWAWARVCIVSPRLRDKVPGDTRRIAIPRTGDGSSPAWSRWGSDRGVLLGAKTKPQRKPPVPFPARRGEALIAKVPPPPPNRRGIEGEVMIMRANHAPIPPPLQSPLPAPRGPLTNRFRLPDPRKLCPHTIKPFEHPSPPSNQPHPIARQPACDRLTSTKPTARCTKPLISLHNHIAMTIPQTHRTGCPRGDTPVSVPQKQRFTADNRTISSKALHAIKAHLSCAKAVLQNSGPQ